MFCWVFFSFSFCSAIEMQIERLLMLLFPVLERNAGVRKAFCSAEKVSTVRY